MKLISKKDKEGIKQYYIITNVGLVRGFKYENTRYNPMKVSVSSIPKEVIWNVLIRPSMYKGLFRIYCALDTYFKHKDKGSLAGVIKKEYKDSGMGRPVHEDTENIEISGTSYFGSKCSVTWFDPSFGYYEASFTYPVLAGWFIDNVQGIYKYLIERGEFVVKIEKK